jgi:hypothetical protein
MNKVTRLSLSLSLVPLHLFSSSTIIKFLCASIAKIYELVSIHLPSKIRFRGCSFEDVNITKMR